MMRQRHRFARRSRAMASRPCSRARVRRRSCRDVALDDHPRCVQAQLCSRTRAGPASGSGTARTPSVRVKLLRTRRSQPGWWSPPRVKNGARNRSQEAELHCDVVQPQLCEAQRRPGRHARVCCVPRGAASPSSPFAAAAAAAHVVVLQMTVALALAARLDFNPMTDSLKVSERWRQALAAPAATTRVPRVRHTLA